ncbi:MAG TPA: PAS domain S-box protein, partial [Azonexus sp.]|nr:PAS domain S-box protein [Azonexus sp.]
DITLLNVADETRRQQGDGGIKTREIEAFLAKQNTHIPESLGLQISDAAGTTRHTESNLPANEVSITDRPYFTRLRDEAKAGLVVSSPLAGRSSVKPVIVLARRLNKPDGSFAGTVHTAVPVAYFIEQFAQQDLGNQGNLELWTRANLIARYSKDDPAGATTGSTSTSPQLRSLLKSELDETTYQAKSGVDGISRIYRFHRVKPYPLFLVVGLADEDYLAQWRSDSRRIAGLVLLFLFVTLVFARLAYVRWQRREMAQVQLNEVNIALLARNEEVEAARQRSELILASAGDGICAIDTAGKITFINRAAREMFGWEENEGIGADLHALTHRHHPNASPVPVDESPSSATICDGKQRQVAEDCYWRRDGSTFLVEYTVSALEQDGEITGAVIVFRDSSERKHNDKEFDQYRHDLEALIEERAAALMKIETKTRHMLDSSAGGLYGIDNAGMIAFINPAACAMLGYTAEQVIGRSAHALFHHSKADGTPYPPDDCPSYLALRQGQRICVDNEVYWRADGQPIAVMYATHPMEKNGEITGAVTSFVDLSEQCAAAEACERAMIAAENLARMRNEFLANISHEIHTPLNALPGLAEIGQRNH